MAKREPAKVDITGENFDQSLVDINSFADLEKQNIADIGEIVGGFIPLSDQDKDKLIDVPFIILGWKEYVGDAGPFKSMFVLSRDNEKYVVNDGSSGIFEQLNDFEAREVPLPVYVANGLRKSTYPVKDGAPMTREQKQAGETPDSMGTTYYIDTTRAADRR